MTTNRERSADANLADLDNRLDIGVVGNVSLELAGHRSANAAMNASTDSQVNPTMAAYGAGSLETPPPIPISMEMSFTAAPSSLADIGMCTVR